MKHILVVRHADSGYDFFSSDFERKLTDVGTAQCMLLDTFIHKKQLGLQLIVASSALRTMETASSFSSPSVPIQPYEELYNASAEQLVKVIQQTNNQFDTIAVVGHNPGITDLINLHSNVKIDVLPTGSAVFLNTNVNDWNDFGTQTMSYIHFHKP